MMMVAALLLLCGSSASHPCETLYGQKLNLGLLDRLSRKALCSRAQLGLPPAFRPLAPGCALLDSTTGSQSANADTEHSKATLVPPVPFEWSTLSFVDARMPNEGGDDLPASDADVVFYFSASASYYGCLSRADGYTTKTAGSAQVRPAIGKPAPTDQQAAQWQAGTARVTRAAVISRLLRPICCRKPSERTHQHAALFDRAQTPIDDARICTSGALPLSLSLVTAVGVGADSGSFT